ncbi:MAG: hypothetical protein OEY84_01870 [Rhodospirillaceae bacterium]|nr:hypothetical protein [Rhodospirillaceae bacterium]MDH5771859.1 hypothetical protein [Rhodospirillaceae bacterium]
MHSNKLFVTFTATAFIILLNISFAAAQNSSESMHGNMHGNMNENMHHEQMPTLPGQGAFGALAEIIAILEADPNTDWAKVNIGALRAHLVDMNLLIIDTDINSKNIDGGLEITINAKGRALKAVHSMVPAHAPMINGLNGWNAKAETTTSGAKLTVSSSDAKETLHIRALGFYGLMVSGSHHQAHHLGLARGEAVHGE